MKSPLSGASALRAAKAAARERIGKSVSVADGYLAWSLLLLRRGGVDVATWPSLVDYLARMQARPQVKAAIDHEIELQNTVKV